ncbi:MAG TPA: heavy-metal-associated domain-containing protein [Burkholderiaceae bacterium]|nr:heavy-metal-associated domain-containing protein [Burkholderiaceae bacterium]
MNVELKVQGMTCGHCVRAVTAAVRQVDPDAQVDIDLASGRVSAQTSAQRDQLVAAIQQEGYAVVG